MSSTTTINRPKLSEILHELIRAKGLSVSEFARRINLPQPTIQRMTSGTHSNPHQKTLNAISNYFGVSIDQLKGFEPIPWLSIKNNIELRKIPLITSAEAAIWPNVQLGNLQQIIVDKKIGNQSYSMLMPDASMEPLIPKGSLLIIDPDKKPKYRSFIIVKLKNHIEVIVRQLITDAKNCYIKSLSPDLEQFQMILLSSDDLIIGTIIEVRLQCEDY